MAVQQVPEVVAKESLPNMKKILVYIFVLHSMILFSQESLDGFLSRFNNERIPYISVQELAMPKTKAIILDAREREEYEVSHIKNAIYVGYDNFDLKKVTSKIKDKNQPIVVYCSLGVRSEDIAENLKKAGYVEVSNLYGGIFEWKNKGYTVYDASESETEKVHAFSERWSKFLKQGIKVYE